MGGGGGGGGDASNSNQPIGIPIAPMGGSFAPPPPPQRGNPFTAGGPGRTYFQQNPDVGQAYAQNTQGLSPTDFAKQHYQQFGQYENRSDPSQQFFQPVYQPQYQNYSMGNSMGVSQYGQTPNMFAMQTPFSFGGQQMGGGYGQYGMNNPFSPYSNTFLNMPSDMQGATAEQKADVYRDAMSRGFNDQQMRNQATGLYGPQSNQEWGWLQGLSMGMTPGLGQGTMQDKANFYNQALGQGYSDSVIRNAANQMMGQQSQGDWSYLQNQAMQTPFSMQQPQTNYGPRQSIVSRSAGMRGTPNVIRRAEGGITSLLDKE